MRHVHILSTTFLRLTNKEILVPNHQLQHMAIENYKRSPPAVLKVDLHASSATTAAQLELLRQRLNSYLETQPLAWKPQCMIRMAAIKDQSIVLSVWLSSHYSWQDAPRLWRAIFLLFMHLLAALRECGVAFRAADQTVRVTGALDTRMVPPLGAGGGLSIGMPVLGNATSSPQLSSSASGIAVGGGMQLPLSVSAVDAPLATHNTGGAETAAITSALHAALEKHFSSSSSQAAAGAPVPVGDPATLAPARSAVLSQQQQQLQHLHIHAPGAAVPGAPLSAALHPHTLLSTSSFFGALPVGSMARDGSIVLPARDASASMRTAASSAAAPAALPASVPLRQAMSVPGPGRVPSPTATPTQAQLQLMQQQLQQQMAQLQYLQQVQHMQHMQQPVALPYSMHPLHAAAGGGIPVGLGSASAPTGGASHADLAAHYAALAAMYARAGAGSGAAGGSSAGSSAVAPAAGGAMRSRPSAGQLVQLVSADSLAASSGPSVAAAAAAAPPSTASVSASASTAVQ